MGDNEAARMAFVFSAIEDHKNSKDYKTAKDAKLYAEGKNATISKYQKWLYTLTGQAVPDNYTANHKCKSGFFRRFVTQETAYEVGNGVTFQNEGAKEKLGKDIDSKLYKGVKAALVQGVSFGFFNYDHVEFYELTEFCPLYDERTGALMAGIRWWKIDENKPTMATLFELDGYTEYQKINGTESISAEKRDYKEIVRSSAVEGVVIEPGGNYPGFPIVPLWGNMEHQSEIVGHREQIDCYDLIKSGFANDLDDASMIYWTISNAGGMDDEDLGTFIERMKTLHAAATGGDGETKVESHTVDVPYQSREVYLSRLEKDLYKDFMALDVDQIAAGNVTATQIQAAYEPLNEKCDELEMLLCNFFDGILEVAGIKDDTPTFERSQISNQTEQTNMVLAAAEYLDDETILRKLPFLTADEIEGILKRKDAEDAERYKQMEKELDGLKNNNMEE